MSVNAASSVFLSAISISLLMGCGGGGTNWADEKKSMSGHNTPASWVRTPIVNDVNLSPSIFLLRKGQSIAQKSFAAALREYREGDEIKLSKGVYPYVDEVAVSGKVSRVLITGEGHESVVVFVRNAGGKFFSPHIVTHAPITFRDVQVVGPMITSTQPEARLWFEGAFVSGRFEHFGRELMGGTPAQVFILGGFYSNESSFGPMSPPSTVKAFQPNYLFSVTHTPGLAMRNSHYSFYALRNSEIASFAPALSELGTQLNKLRASGGYGLPNEPVMTGAIREIYSLTRSARLSTHPNYGPQHMTSPSNNVTLESFNRLANYLYLKTGSKEVIEVSPQASLALEKAKAALKTGAPTLALFLASQFDYPKFHSAHKDLDQVVSQALNALQSQHGCQISIKVQGSVSGDEFRPQSIIGNLRQKTAALYPAAYLSSKAANGCSLVADVYQSVFTHWQSEISTNVTTTLVETDQARSAREAALAANSRDVWKEAFSTVGNAASRAGERSRQVWANHEKTRTRVEERGSGTYLIYYKGNPNLPPLQAPPAGGQASNSASGGSAGTSGAGSGDMREKKTVRKRYYLYGSHEVDYGISITEGGKLVTKFERTKHRTATKRGPCESESVDGWRPTLLSGDCYVNGLPRSGEIGRAMQDSLIAYMTTNRLPKVVDGVRSLYGKGSRILQAEAALVAALYGGQPEGPALNAIREEAAGIYRVAPQGTQLTSDLAGALYMSSLL